MTSEEKETVKRMLEDGYTVVTEDLSKEEVLNRYKGLLTDKELEALDKLGEKD